MVPWRIQKYANGDVYEGEWKDDKKMEKEPPKYGAVYEGNGKMIKKWKRNLEILVALSEGNFKNGWFHGKGIKKFTNGDVYEGEWKDCNSNVKGTYKYAWLCL